MTGVGLIVAVAGLVLAARSAQLLAGRGRPKRGPQPSFVVAGPYVRVRNPMLGGLIIGCAGIAMVARSAGLAAATAAGAGLAHLWVTRVEEPRLSARFGLAYETYLGSVPRWVPIRRTSRLE